MSKPGQMPLRPRRILPIIILAQFAGTSLWFASNAVLGDLQQQLELPAEVLGYMTSAVQFGFIAGTLGFAFFAISDIFSPRLVFVACSLLGALANAATLALAEGLWSLLGLRFLTGFFLAGIYPVGMRIASGWYQRDLGNALGFLVGALVVGTAFPHMLRGIGQTIAWEAIILAASVIAAVGGLLVLALVPDGPYLPKGTQFNPRALAVIFRSPRFRSSALGYFGHMWELYAFWAFVPILLAAHELNTQSGLNVSMWSFAVIAAGAIGCVAGGQVSLRSGSAPVAFWQLLVSGVCCALSPVLFHASSPLFLAFVLLWGTVVVGDSPQLSALNVANAPSLLAGSALTIANCIGFSVTIVSIQLLSFAVPFLGAEWAFLLLAPGPLVGLLALMPLLRTSPTSAV